MGYKVFPYTRAHYQVAAKARAIAPGGIGAIQLLVRELGHAEAIDQRLHPLQVQSGQWTDFDGRVDAGLSRLRSVSMRQVPGIDSIRVYEIRCKC